MLAFQINIEYGLRTKKILFQLIYEPRTVLILQLPWVFYELCNLKYCGPTSYIIDVPFVFYLLTMLSVDEKDCGRWRTP
jgi:hypothetical protein